jgi:hypothetical protein
MVFMVPPDVDDHSTVEAPAPGVVLLGHEVVATYSRRCASSARRTRGVTAGRTFGW